MLAVLVSSMFFLSDDPPEPPAKVRASLENVIQQVFTNDVTNPEHHEFRATILQFLAGKTEATYRAEYANTPENRAFLAQELAHLYQTFLYPEMHTEGAYWILQGQRMWIQKRYASSPIPTKEQRELFATTMKQKLLDAFNNVSNNRIWVHLGYDYGPNSPIFIETFREVGFNPDFYYILPNKSHIHIHLSPTNIELHLDLRGPLI